MFSGSSAICAVGLEHVRQVSGSVQAAFLGASTKVVEFRESFRSNSICSDPIKSTLVTSYDEQLVCG